MHYCTDPLFQKELYAFHMRSPKMKFIISFIFVTTGPTLSFYITCVAWMHFIKKKKDSFHQEIVLSAIMNYEL